MVAESLFTLSKVKQGENILANLIGLEKLGYMAFQSFSVPGVIIDREGVIVLFTREFRDRYFQHETNIPRTILDIFDGNTENIAKEVRTAQAGVVIVLVQESLKKHLREGFVITPLRDGIKRPNHYLLCKTDHTAVEKGFNKLNAELAQANKDASNARIRQRELANENMHLQQYASIEDYSPQLDEEAKKIVATVQASASRLQKLIEDLLAHSRSCNQKLNFEVLSISEIVEQVVENLYKSITDTNAQIKIEKMNDVIRGDPTLVHQLFENLIGNSIKYRSQDRDPQISIHLTEDNCLEIEDNGLGFDNQYSDHLFEPFKRLYSASKIEGTGLGLATCKSICERHGWTIAATGQQDKGAKFTIRFPNPAN